MKLTFKFPKVKKGGPGSGHHGHSGRPGKRGGSTASYKRVIDIKNVDLFMHNVDNPRQVKEELLQEISTWSVGSVSNVDRKGIAEEAAISGVYSDYLLQIRDSASGELLAIGNANINRYGKFEVENLATKRSGYGVLAMHQMAVKALEHDTFLTLLSTIPSRQFYRKLGLMYDDLSDINDVNGVRMNWTIKAMEKFLRNVSVSKSSDHDDEPVDGCFAHSPHNVEVD